MEKSVIPKRKLDSMCLPAGLRARDLAPGLRPAIEGTSLRVPSRAPPGWQGQAVVLDDYLAVIQSGQTLAFGPFTVDSQGLYYEPDESFRSGPDVTLTDGPVTLDARDLLHKMPGSQKAKFVTWDEFNSLDVRPQRWQPNLNEVVVTRKLPKAHPDHV